MNFKYTIQLPSTKANILISEITTGQQKEYLKALLQPNNYEFGLMMHSLLSENTNLEINKLTLIDKLALLLKLREMSIGDRVEYAFECETCKKHLKHSLSLVSVLGEIYKIKFPKEEIIVHESYSAIIGIPIIETELQIEKDETLLKETEDTFETYNTKILRDIISFTRSIIIGGLSEIDLSSLSVAEKILVIEKLPAKFIKMVFDRIQEIKKVVIIPVLDVDCICGHKVFESNLNLDSNEYTNFLKSVYNENLHNVYQNIYYLTSMLQFSPEYIEKMTPNERELYWSYWHKDQKKKKEEEEQAVTNSSTM